MERIINNRGHEISYTNLCVIAGLLKSLGAIVEIDCDKIEDGKMAEMVAKTANGLSVTLEKEFGLLREDMLYLTSIFCEKASIAYGLDK